MLFSATFLFRTNSFTAQWAQNPRDYRDMRWIAWQNAISLFHSSKLCWECTFNCHIKSYSEVLSHKINVARLTQWGYRLSHCQIYPGYQLSRSDVASTQQQQKCHVDDFIKAKLHYLWFGFKRHICLFSSQWKLVYAKNKTIYIRLHWVWSISRLK